MAFVAPYTYEQLLGVQAAAKAVPKAVAQGLPSPVSFCPACSSVIPNHFPTCKLLPFVNTVF
jgi:hypothetical protein